MQLGVMTTQLNTKEDCYVTGQTPKAAIVCDLKIVLASPKIALYEKGALVAQHKKHILPKEKYSDQNVIFVRFV